MSQALDLQVVDGRSRSRNSGRPEQLVGRGRGLAAAGRRPAAAGALVQGRAPRMLNAVDHRASMTRAVGPISMTVCSSASRRVATLRPRSAAAGPPVAGDDLGRLFPGRTALTAEAGPEACRGHGRRGADLDSPPDPRGGLRGWAPRPALRRAPLTTSLVADRPGGGTSAPEASSGAGQTHRLPLQGRTPFVDIPIAGPLLSSTMSVIAQAIADRQGEIDRLQAEIKALTDVEQLLGASAPAARSASRRSSPRKATAAPAESQPEVKPQRKRREMTAAEKKAVSERMTAYWAERRKKAAKK